MTSENAGGRGDSSSIESEQCFMEDCERYPIWEAMIPEGKQRDPDWDRGPFDEWRPYCSEHAYRLSSSSEFKVRERGVQ